MPRTCVNSPDNFCYVCGEVTFSSQKRTITAMVKKGCHLYFGCKIGDQNKSWAPRVCCNTCATNLRQWLNRKRKSIPFAVPMIWREPTDHTSNCYFCLVPAIDKGLSKKKKATVQYPNIPSATRSIAVLLCKWDSRAKAAHYVRQNWPMRQSVEPVQKSVQHPPLVESEKNLVATIAYQAEFDEKLRKSNGQNSTGFPVHP